MEGDIATDIESHNPDGFAYTEVLGGITSQIEAAWPCERLVAVENQQVVCEYRYALAY